MNTQRHQPPCICQFEFIVVVVVFETHGRWGGHAVAFLQRIANCATTAGVPRASFMRRATLELSIALQRGNASCGFKAFQRLVRGLGSDWRQGEAASGAGQGQLDT